MNEGRKQQKHTMTRECLFTALLLLMEQKPYDEITITDIAKKAGVSRMSYYRLYQSKDDILIQCFDDIFGQLLDQVKKMEKIDRYEFALLVFRTALEHRKLVESMFHAKLYEMVARCIVGCCAHLAENVFGLDMDDVQTDYQIYGTSGRFCLMIYRWCERGMQETPEQMAEMIQDKML